MLALSTDTGQLEKLFAEIWLGALPPHFMCGHGGDCRAPLGPKYNGSQSLIRDNTDRDSIQSSNRAPCFAGCCGPSAASPRRRRGPSQAAEFWSAVMVIRKRPTSRAARSSETRLCLRWRCFSQGTEALMPDSARQLDFQSAAQRRSIHLCTGGRQLLQGPTSL